MSDETSKGAAPNQHVTDMCTEAERGNVETLRIWCVPGIEDSTPESLGMPRDAAERLRNGGFTKAELEKLKEKSAGGQVTR